MADIIVKIVSMGGAMPGDESFLNILWKPDEGKTELFKLFNKVINSASYDDIKKAMSSIFAGDFSTTIDHEYITIPKKYVLGKALDYKLYDEIFYAMSPNKQTSEFHVGKNILSALPDTETKKTFLLMLFYDLKANAPQKLPDYFNALTQDWNEFLLHTDLFENIIKNLSEPGNDDDILYMDDIKDINLNSRSFVGKTISLQQNVLENEKQILLALNSMVDIAFSVYYGNASSLDYWRKASSRLSKNNAEKAVMHLLQADRAKKDASRNYDDERLTYRQILPVLSRYPDLVEKYMPILEYYSKLENFGNKEVLVALNAINYNPSLKNIIFPLMSNIKGDKLTNFYLDNAEKLDGVPMSNGLLSRFEYRYMKRTSVFLDNFTNKIRDIAMNEYGEKDYWNCIGEALENIEYRKRAEAVYSEMLQDREKYSDIRYYSNNNNAYIRKQFPELVNILKNNEEYRVDDLEEDIIFIKNYDMVLNAIGSYDNRRLAMEIAKLGVDNRRQAKAMASLFYQLNDRPSKYASSYNKYYPKDLASITEINMPEWMYEPIFKAIENKKISADRLGSVHILFDACKAWQFSPHFRKKDAVHIGKMPMVYRMIAGGVMDKIHNNATDQERDNAGLLSSRFWAEMKVAQDMGVDKALELYLKDKMINRKRILSARYNNRLSTDEMNFLVKNTNIKTVLDFKISAFHKATNVLYDLEWQEKGYKGDISAELRKHVHSEKDLENNTWNYKSEDGVNIDLKLFYYDRKDWIIHGATAVSQVFGKTFPDYLRKTKGYLNVHDAVYWLPVDLTPNKNESLAVFLHKNIVYPDINGNKLVRKIEDLEVIAKNWRSLKPNEEKQSFKEVLAICRSKKYENQISTEFAEEAAKWGVDESKYKRYESIYLAGQKISEPFDRNVIFEANGLKGRFLPRYDTRVGFFGNYTGCCQHFDGVGAACAISSVKDPFSQCFAIENSRGEIVAGSWIWEGRHTEKYDDGELKTYKTATFDNVEAKQSYSDKDTDFVNIYKQAGQYLAKQNYRKVTIGSGMGDMSLSEFDSISKIDLPRGYSGYSDANSQVLLSENVNAVSISEKEGKTYISGASQDDMLALEDVAKKCFPEGSQNIEMPDDNPQVLVLRDVDKGIVGYAAYSDEEKYITDMAVLPEYRVDENMSSKKLLDAMMSHIATEGGEWRADLRDKTSMVYMLLQAKRGAAKIIDFDENEYYSMSNGDKVYTTKFEFVPIEDRMRIAKDNEDIIKIMESKIGKNKKPISNLLSRSIDRVRNLRNSSHNHVDNTEVEQPVDDGQEEELNLVRRPRRNRYGLIPNGR